jgi:DNA ligase-1
MRLTEVVATSRAVAEASGRLRKIELLAALLERTPPAEVEAAVAFLAGSPRQGRIGVGRAAMLEARAVNPAVSPTLALADVDRRFGALAAVAGSGSIEIRIEMLRDLLRLATADEQSFLVRVVAGDLRQGALEGVLVDAVARAAAVPADRLRRAAMFAGALPPVARAALVDGEAALSRFLLRPFRPVQPMLADSASDVVDAMAALGQAALEYKLDGVRVQVHKADDEVKVYSRNLRDITAAVPEVVAVTRAIPAREIVLDGEAIALRPNGTPHPFQITMRRLGRKLEVDRLRQEIPITPFFFDALYLDGDPLVDEPFHRRAAVLSDRLPASSVVPRIVTATPREAEAFAARAAAAGHEGVMAKALAGVYAAGRRGSAWLKVKRARTLDLVVLAAEWGSGRRHGLLSNLHLGARDEERGGFVMLGKTFKGLTDEVLAWQTTRLLELEMGRDDYTIHVRPELVVEIAFNDIQVSPQYPGGLALRFARVKRYRTDKPAANADSFGAVQSIYRETTGSEPPVR